MRLPIIATTAHKGKALELDSQRETITLVGLRGERLGSVTWGALIDHILATTEASRVPEARTEPRVSLLIKVRYGTPGGRRLESRAVGIGVGGMFIESTNPLAIGTQVEIEFSLPDHPDEWLEAKGTVAWVCPKADQYRLSPGMGISFVDLAPEVRTRVMELVKSVKWATR